VDGVDPCLIILDLFMPGMDGFQFRHWQLGSPFAQVPIIVFSAGYDVARVQQITGLPAVRKTADPDEVLLLVRLHCAA